MNTDQQHRTRGVSGSLWRRGALALALGGCVVAPASALAASRTLRLTDTVKVNRAALASGQTVKVKATVRNPDRRVASWWSYRTVTTVVRKGVNGGYQRPYSSQGYRCSPVVRGQTTSFTCSLRGADVATSVTLGFAAKYRTH